MAEFKQLTAYTHQFLMVLASDHISGATGKTVVVKLGKNGATGGTAVGTVAEVDSTNLPGVYSIGFTSADTNTAGSLALAATVSGGTCDPTNEFHQVRGQIFTDLLLDGSGNAKVASNIKQNTATTLFFTMTVNGVVTPGLTVTGTKNFGSGFSAIAGTITDLGSGDYKCALQAADTNAASGVWRFIAVGADDRNINFVTTP
jgi:hypothetical protein